ncbi:MAG: hypothetical protein WCH46_05260 [bacterium]
MIASISGITYIYWASLFMHLFSAVAWLGGILFLTGVSRPIFEYYGEDAIAISHRIKVRFLGFTWMLLWTVFVTGIIILLWSPKFIFLDFGTLWRLLAHLKIVLFFCLASVSLLLRKTYKELDTFFAEATGFSNVRDRLLLRIRVLEQMEVSCAIAILLVVALMQVYG